VKLKLVGGWRPVEVTIVAFSATHRSLIYQEVRKEPEVESWWDFGALEDDDGRLGSSKSDEFKRWVLRYPMAAGGGGVVGQVKTAGE
jgi:hypothetical protein